MSSFTFSEVLGHLVAAIPEDRPELIQRKEEWLRDWNKLERAAAHAVAAKAVVKAPSAPAPSSSAGRGVLIRHPRETPEDATAANSEDEEEGEEEEEEEESVEDSRKRKSPDSWEVEFDLLADADGDEEDLYLEGKVRVLYAKMLTMQGMLMEMMMEVDSLAVRCKKRRRIQ
ncbi:hypothetical protein DFJ58DRAFT_732869 [Suillus subalutaceus]|uniref:uncharacterized protein n=1 Tax=Suillus subalutaceus TaxID=48586 RepID=UPI001B86FCD2|nr:uncharacterized protein DFJ58DRAFT_732869 [Suillus subalutaceus]KAG1840501.1 hypothetical protein DFJ58DRAFT_732869 [Suillus subalutaceus]